MVTDPPYGIELDKSFRYRPTINIARRGGMVGDDVSDWYEAWKLWPAQVAYVWHAAMKADLVKAGLEQAGYDVRQQIIWVKEIATLSPAAYHWRHECLWYCVRRSMSAHWLGDKRETTVWEFPSPISVGASHVDDAATRHPAQKPLEAYEKCIANHLSAGTFLVDPFVGSGTAIMAAERLGRRCMAMDIDPKWCEVAIQRWEAYTGQEAHRM